MANTVDTSKVQGNILKGFNKDYVRLLFFQFGNNSDEAKRWLAGMANSGKIPNTKELMIASERIKKRSYEKPRETYLHVSLTAKGILKLGLTLPPSKGLYKGRGKSSKINYQTVTQEDPFARGMKTRAKILGDTGDSHYTKWVKPYRDDAIDALVIVASDSENDAEKESNDITKKAERAGIRLVGREKGNVIKKDDHAIEHFGFRDGISDPLFKGINDTKIAKRIVNKDVLDPEDFVLFGLTGNLEWANNGSFLAFRRLKQDVYGFWNFTNNLSRNLGLSCEELLAKFMGRYRDGRPLHRYSRANSSRDYNDFDYRTDPSGLQTPAFSHIRKTNPRGSTYTKEKDSHRILRRGITYGPIAPPFLDGQDRGLLFICYQRDLEMQFEYVQHAMASNPNFPSPGVGHDPVIGRPAPSPHGLVNLGGSKILLSQWVTTTGGEYFFSPSIPALKNLYKSAVGSKDRQQPSSSSVKSDYVKQEPITYG